MLKIILTELKKDIKYKLLETGGTEILIRK